MNHYLQGLSETNFEQLKNILNNYQLVDLNKIIALH